MNEIKTSRLLALKGVVIAVLTLAGAYIGKDLISGETLATIDNIIAGGIGATSFATLMITLLIQNFLPKSTGEQVSNQILPIIQNSNLSVEEKVLSLASKVDVIIDLLQTQEEQRQAILNENNEV
jgi:hypothetical protein